MPRDENLSSRKWNADIFGFWAMSEVQAVTDHFGALHAPLAYTTLFNTPPAHRRFWHAHAPLPAFRHDVIMMPRRYDSPLKLAGPSAQPRILNWRSASLNANMRRYSSNDRPHGFTSSSVNGISPSLSAHRGFRFLVTLKRCTPVWLVASLLSWFGLRIKSCRLRGH